MHEDFYLDDREAVKDATELLTEFGPLAGQEADLRANRSRDLGNVIHFCRWRQIRRLLDWLDDEPSDITLH